MKTEQTRGVATAQEHWGHRAGRGRKDPPPEPPEETQDSDTWVWDLGPPERGRNMFLLCSASQPVVLCSSSHRKPMRRPSRGSTMRERPRSPSSTQPCPAPDPELQQGGSGLLPASTPGSYHTPASAHARLTGGPGTHVVCGMPRRLLRFLPSGRAAGQAWSLLGAGDVIRPRLGGTGNSRGYWGHGQHRGEGVRGRTLGEPRMGRAWPTASRPPPGPTLLSCAPWDLPSQACLWGCVLRVHKVRTGPGHMTQKMPPPRPSPLGPHPAALASSPTNGSTPPALWLQGGPSWHRGSPGSAVLVEGADEGGAEGGRCPRPLPKCTLARCLLAGHPQVPRSLALCRSMPGPEAASVHIQNGLPKSLLASSKAASPASGGRYGQQERARLTIPPQEKLGQSTLQPPQCGTQGPGQDGQAGRGLLDARRGTEEASQPVLHLTWQPQ